MQVNWVTPNYQANFMQVEFYVVMGKFFHSLWNEQKDLLTCVEY